jgi:hypothetical protein
VRLLERDRVHQRRGAAKSHAPRKLKFTRRACKCMRHYHRRSVATYAKVSIWKMGFNGSTFAMLE